MGKFSRPDGRTRWARRIRDIEKQLTSALGVRPRPHQLILLKAAAEQTAIAEKTRADYLDGRPVEVNDVVRAGHAMIRAINSLQISSGDIEELKTPIFIITPADAKL
jgi:hypothetical protein